MNGVLQAPAVTAFDAVASLVSLIAYLGVAAAVLRRGPRVSAARVFAAVALASAVPYVLSPLQWWNGPRASFSPLVVTVTAVAFSLGSAALFHFAQVFPWRRPWIRAHPRWLAAAYVVPLVPLGAIAWFVTSLIAPVAGEAAGGLGAVSDAGVALAILAVIPVVFVVGIVLPFAGVMSFFKSWQEATVARNEPARKATFWILVSQLAGGVLAVLVLPMLDFVGVRPAWATVIGALAYGFSLVFPLTFATAVWKYRLLDVSTSA